MNTAPLHHLHPTPPGFSLFFFLPPLYCSTSNSPSLYLSTVLWPLFFFFSISFHWWELLSSYAVHLLPSHSLASPCTFAFSGLYKPSHLYYNLHCFSYFQLCNSLLSFLSLHLCVPISLLLLYLPIYYIHPLSIFSNWQADVDSGWLMFR